MAIKIILIIAIFLNVLLSTFVFSQNPRELSNRLFSMLSFLGAIWTFMHYMLNVSHSVFWFLCTFALGSLVISTGLIWTIVITEKSISRIKILFISFFSLLFFIASLTPGFILQLATDDLIINSSINTYGWGLYIFSVYYITFGFLIILKLYRSQKNSTKETERSQFRFILIGALISLTASGLTTFVIPLRIISMSGIIDSTGFLIFLLFIAYTITRHRLFNIRVIAIELVTFGLWVTILVRMFLAHTRQEVLMEGAFLLMTIIFGVMLIRGTLHEIKQREYIEKLANDLHKAYGAIKDLNQKLDRTKNQPLG